MLSIEHATVIKQFKQNRLGMLAVILKNGAPQNRTDQSYVYLLNEMSVTQLSKFKDEVWDYNSDVRNPSRNVTGAKLRLDFSKYGNIPPFVLIELKCLMHYVAKEPGRYNSSLRRKKVLKYNTIITQFENGLRFLDHTFSKLNKLGKEFVKRKFQAISELLESDFVEAAKDYPFTANKALYVFFYYLKHPATNNILEHDIQIDFNSLVWLTKKIKKDKNSPVLENDVFEKLMRHATFRVVEFLKLMNKEVNDKVASVHFENLKQGLIPLTLTPQIINDYGIVRLLSKGYSKDFIEERYEVNSSFLKDGGQLKIHEDIRKLLKALHGVDNLNNIREQIREIYHASCFIVGIYTGMRPNALSEVSLSNSLIKEDGYDLLLSLEHKNVVDTLQLFNDKWIAIPIVKDAIECARIIGQFKNNDYLFSNMETTAPTHKRKHRNMASTGIKHVLESYFKTVLGADVAGVKFNPYVLRHTLAYQLFRAELGLPFISFQLKHIVEQVESYTSHGATSDVTMSYGGIGEQLGDNKIGEIRKLAEIERVKSLMNPDGVYLGPKGQEHKARLQRMFKGFVAAGYSHEEVYEQMANQGMAVINMGTGFCFGGEEDFDDSLPCIGTLRCNPIRCTNAVVTQSHAPKWREVYISNKALVNKKGYEDMQDQILAAMREAESVLKHLGQEVIT